MRQDYFVYNNHRYNAGDHILFRFFDCRVGRSYETKVKFLYYDTESKEYSIEIYGKEYSYREELFYRNIYERDSYSSQATREPKEHTFSDELKIRDLRITWVLYVFAMLVSVVFYERIIAWIFVSLVFFSYRSKMLKAHGYK